MTVVSDLPAESKLIPESWTWTMTPTSREHFLAWQVPYGKFNEFVQKTIYTVATVAVGGGTITRVHPLVCPTDPDLVALEIRPGQPSQINQRGQSDPAGPWEEILDEDDHPTGVYRPRTSAPPWGFVYPLVRFGIPPFPTSSGDQAFLSLTEESNTERVTVPGIPYSLYDGVTLVERVAQDIGLSRGSTTFRVQYHEVNDLPALQAVIHPMLDKVNDAEVTIPFIGAVCPAGTLKTASKSSSVTLSYGNNKKSTLSLLLNYLPGGWNYAVASAPAHAGQLLRIDSTAGPPFAAVSFDDIFAPTA
jgi:hypothetical protein